VPAPFVVLQIAAAGCVVKSGDTADGMFWDTVEL
jgi:hypothetical protein